MRLLLRLLLSFGLALYLPFSANAQNSLKLKAVYGESETYYFSNHLPDYGFYSRIVSAAFAQSGYSVNFQADNWKRAIRDTAATNYDLLAGGWSTKARKEIFLISDPYAFNRMAFVKRSDNAIPSIDAANPGTTRFALVRDSYQAELVKSPNVILVADSTAVIRLILYGRVDVGVIEERTAIGLIDRYSEDKEHVLTLMPEPAAKAATSIMVSKQHPQGPEIIAAFNEGLRHLIESGEYAKLLEGSGLEGTMINRSGAALQN